MSRTAKIDRARRNTLKAASLVGAFLATSALHSQASAAPGNNGNGNGGCGVGQQTNGCGGNGNNGNSGGNCFALGTLIRTREGYRQIETLAVGDEVAVRFGGLRADQGNGQPHLEQRGGANGLASLTCRSSCGAVLWARIRRTPIFASRLCIPSSLMVS
jgi:hypothetical protein